MGVRMMCTECFRTEEPDTIIEGSDRTELWLWCCGILPGLVYCYWRHSNRLKICPHCSSGELIREARAARRKRLALEASSPPAPARPPRIFSAEGSGLLSRVSGTPRDRLHRSRQLGTAFAGSVAVLLAAGVNVIQVAPAPGVIPIDLLQSHEGASPAQLASGRSRECWWLCAEFHEPGTLGVRDCVDTCVESRKQGEERRLALESCADVMDRITCEIAVGAPGPGADG